MPIEIRPFRVGDPAETEALVRSDLRAFSSELAPEELIRRFDSGHEHDRFVVADDDGELVGNAGALSMRLTVAPEVSVPAAGVTWVAVSPTHRRRGLMRRLIEAVHAEARRRGEPVAVLWASESSIYEHLGYGQATVVQSIELHPRLLRWRDTTPRRDGSIRVVEAVDLAPFAAAVRSRHSLQRVGAIDEHSRRWSREAWAVRWRDGPEAPGTFAAIHSGPGSNPDGDPDGYVLYRVRERWDGGHPRHLLDVLDLVACTAEAHRDLWRFVCSIDLVGEITAGGVSPDDPLPWLLQNPREVRTTARNDALWVRLLDVGAFFGARLAGVEASVVVEVIGTGAGDDDPAVSGRWRLGAGGAARTDAGPEVVSAAAELGAMSLGGHDPRVLADAGRITETAPGGLARLAEVLRAPHIPHCDIHF